MTLAGVNHFYRSVFWLLFAAAVIVLTLNFLQNQLKTKPFTLVKNLAYFAAMNIALIDGFFKWLRGIRGNTWQRTTRE